MPYKQDVQVGQGTKQISVYSKTEVDKLFLAQSRLTDRAKSLSGGGSSGTSEWTSISGKPFKTVNTSTGQLVINGTELELPQGLGPTSGPTFDSLTITSGNATLNGQDIATTAQLYNFWELKVDDNETSPVTVQIGDGDFVELIAGTDIAFIQNPSATGYTIQIENDFTEGPDEFINGGNLYFDNAGGGSFSDELELTYAQGNPPVYIDFTGLDNRFLRGNGTENPSFNSVTINGQTSATTNQLYGQWRVKYVDGGANDTFFIDSNEYVELVAGSNVSIVGGQVNDGTTDGYQLNISASFTESPDDFVNGGTLYFDGAGGNNLAPDELELTRSESPPVYVDFTALDGRFAASSHQHVEADITDLGPYDNYQFWTVDNAGGSPIDINSNAGGGEALSLVGQGATEITFDQGTKTITISSTDTETAEQYANGGTFIDSGGATFDQQITVNYNTGTPSSFPIDMTALENRYALQTDYFAIANNLSEGTPSTIRDNIGLGTGDDPEFKTLNLIQGNTQTAIHIESSGDSQYNLDIDVNLANEVINFYADTTRFLHTTGFFDVNELHLGALGNESILILGSDELQVNNQKLFTAGNEQLLSTDADPTFNSLTITSGTATLNGQDIATVPQLYNDWTFQWEDGGASDSFIVEAQDIVEISAGSNVSIIGGPITGGYSLTVSASFTESPDEFMNGATFDDTTGEITFNYAQGFPSNTVDIDGRYALSSHNHTVADITDLVSTTPSDGDILIYNNGNAQYENRILNTSDIPDLSGSYDNYISWDVGIGGSYSSITSGDSVDFLAGGDLQVSKIGNEITYSFTESAGSNTFVNGGTFVDSGGGTFDQEIQLDYNDATSGFVIDMRALDDRYLVANGETYVPTTGGTFTGDVNFNEDIFLDRTGTSDGSESKRIYFSNGTSGAYMTRYQNGGDADLQGIKVYVHNSPTFGDPHTLHTTFDRTGDLDINSGDVTANDFIADGTPVMKSLNFNGNSFGDNDSVVINGGTNVNVNTAVNAGSDITYTISATSTGGIVDSLEVDDTTQISKANIKILGGTSISTDFVPADTVEINYTGASDRRMKENEQPMSADWATFNQLQPRWFDWREEYTPSIRYDSSLKDGGLIAQEFAELYPELTTRDPNGMMGIDYPKLTAVLVTQIQDLKQQVEALQTP